LNAIISPITLIQMNTPLAYFLSWHAYGTWLPGHYRGYVDDEHRQFGEAFADADPKIVLAVQQEMSHPVFRLDEPRRVAVQEAVDEVCRYRGWQLFAFNARTTHAHAVVAAAVSPEKVLGDFKAYATRRLRRDGLADADSRVWATHGSTIYVWQPGHFNAVLEYVVARQGVPMTPPPIDRREPGR